MPHETLVTSPGRLSESASVCQTRSDRIIITAVASSGLLNCGNSLVKSDVSVAPLSSVRAPEQWESEDEPQGTGNMGWQEEQGLSIIRFIIH